MTVQDDHFLAAVDNGSGEWEPLFNRHLAPFPTRALPTAVAAMVEATAEHTQTPTDLAALNALGVLSAAALGAKVDCGNWDEEVTLYVLVVMPTGDRKSTVLKTIAGPLREIERRRQEEAAPDVRRRKSRRDVLEKRKRDLTNRVAKADAVEDRAPAEADLEDVWRELDEIGEPVLPRLLVDDATPEALGEQLYHHGSIAVLAAESALIDNLTGRYNEGKPNLHLVCQAYSGEADDDRP